MTRKGERRGHKEGSYTPLQSGRIRWRVWVEVRGVLERRGGTTDTEKQARAEVRRLLDAAEGSKAPSRSPVTLGEYVNAWIRDRDGFQDKTRDMYAAHARRDIVPTLGAVKLKALTVSMLRDFQTNLREKRRLGYNSRRQIHLALHGALNQAVTDGLIPINPAAAPGVRPAPERKAAEDLPAFTPDEAAAYMQAAQDGQNRLGMLLAFLLHTGLRKGEALALQWPSVTLDGSAPLVEVRGTRSQSGGRVYENQNGKTKAARRKVPLSPEALRLLEKVQADTRYDSARLDVPASPYVFSKLKDGGGAYRPDNLDRVHTAVCERAGIRRLPIHALRHTYASLMAMQGMRIEVLAALLGHEDPAFTLRQYRHLYPEELQAVSLKLPEVPSVERKTPVRRVTARERKKDQEVEGTPKMARQGRKYRET